MYGTCIDHVKKNMHGACMKGMEHVWNVCGTFTEHVGGHLQTDVPVAVPQDGDDLTVGQTVHRPAVDTDDSVPDLEPQTDFTRTWI